MKIINRKYIITAICLMLVLIVVLAAVLLRRDTSTPSDVDRRTIITEKTLPEISEILRAAELSDVDLFETWVYEYYENKGDDWESSAYSDADCRMTAMLLADDQISCSNEEEYKGDYLMIDVDKIENEDTYILIRDNLHVFTTLFGETPIPESGIEDALPDNWKKHGIRFYNENSSLVSAVFKTLDRDEVFVGHSGILIDCEKLGMDEKGKYLFVEKLAFGDPFVATWLDSKEALLELLQSRPDYRPEKGEPAPLVYLNDELLGELKY